MKRFSWIVVLFIVIVGSFLLTGYRLTPEAAADAHDFLTKHDERIDHYQVDDRHVYLYKNTHNGSNRLVLVERGFGVYVSETSTYTESNDDAVQTIAGMSVEGEETEVTVFVVQVDDPHVSDITIEVEEQVLKQPVKAGKLVVFLLEQAIQIDQLHAKAITSNGEILYYFGYEKGATRLDELKWHYTGES